jgi:hypothetical protein
LSVIEKNQKTGKAAKAFGTVQNPSVKENH